MINAYASRIYAIDNISVTEAHQVFRNESDESFSRFRTCPRDVRGDGDTFDVEQWTVGKHGFYAQDINACA